MAQPYSGVSNVSQCCEILKSNLNTQEAVAWKVKDLQAKLVIRDNAIKKYYVELNHLWEAVRRRSQESEHEDRDESDDELDEDEFKENLEEIQKEKMVAVREVTSGMAHLRKEYTDTVFCPLTEAARHHSKFSSSPLRFDGIQIKLSNNASIISFKEGSEYYLKEYFPGETTYRIPVGYNKSKKEAKVPKKDFGNRQLSHIPDEDIDNKNSPILSQRKGNIANENIASCFEKWGKEKEKTMMIFTDLRIPDQNVHCPAGFVSTNGDFDVLVLCDEFILLCQVKGVDTISGDSNKSSKLKEAWEQSNKDLLRFGEATRDLSFIFNLPMHTAIAVPNLNSGNLEALGVCKYHCRFILCKCDMEPFSKFDVWISNIINPNNRELTKISEEDYQTLCARFVGLISKVPIPTERQMIIDTDEIVNPKYYVNCKRKLYAILTPDQHQIVHADKKLAIIRGEFGTGKSLVLLAKVLRILEDANNTSQPMIISLASIGNDGHCYHKTKFEVVHHLKGIITLPPEKQDKIVFNFSDLISDYFRSNNLVRDEVGTLVTPELFCGILSSKINTAKQDVHFFFDEVPSCFLEKCESVFGEFVTNFPNSYMWLAIAPHSSKPTQPLHLKYEAVIDRLIKKGYDDARLNRSMRIPKNVFNLVRCMQENECPDLDAISCGHVIPGPKPLFFEVPKCICQHAKRKINFDDILRCKCIEQRFSVTIQNVMTKCELVGKDEPLHSSKCTILISTILGSKLTKPLIGLLRKACASLKIRLNINIVSLFAGDSRASDDKCDSPADIELRVFDQYTFMGCENALIIVIDPYSLFQCGKGNHWTHSMNVFTRTTSQHVHVYWPKDEGLAMWRGDLDSQDALTASRKYLTEEEKYARFEFTESGRKSTEDIVEKLVETNLIIKMPVSMDEETISVLQSDIKAMSFKG
ncbi:uncharacterized protein [Apostichopus japonicus]|uniref:uncharacterized protein isoform X2 n=1 Tax=Stichopus japonicus TaxID=307972 RepID=UPI003AB698F5